MKSRLDGMMSDTAAQARAHEAMAETAPNPSRLELQRQALIINEVLKRLDTLSAAILAVKPPVVNNELPPMNVTVEAATVNVPATVVNVEQPDFKMVAPVVNVEAPSVTVAAPTVNVAPPQVYVSAPSVTVAAPNVTVAAPNVTFTPPADTHQPTSWRFEHKYDQYKNLVETLATSDTILE